MKVYCEKCRVEREIINPKIVKTSAGRQSTQGTCSKCGSKVVKMDRR